MAVNCIYPGGGGGGGGGAGTLIFHTNVGSSHFWMFKK